MPVHRVASARHVTIVGDTTVIRDVAVARDVPIIVDVAVARCRCPCDALAVAIGLDVRVDPVCFPQLLLVLVTQVLGSRAAGLGIHLESLGAGRLLLGLGACLPCGRFLLRCLRLLARQLLLALPSGDPLLLGLDAVSLLLPVPEDEGQHHDDDEDHDDRDDDPDHCSVHVSLP